MNVGVLLHIRFLVKPFTTIFTWVGTGIAVNEHMRGESRGTLEGFSTLFANKLFFAATRRSS